MAGPTTTAFGATKQLLNEGAANGLAMQMEREGRAIAGAIGRAEGQEGVAAFLEKRKPRFSGFTVRMRRFGLILKLGCRTRS